MAPAPRPCTCSRLTLQMQALVACDSPQSLETRAGGRSTRRLAKPRAASGALGLPARATRPVLQASFLPKSTYKGHDISCPCLCCVPCRGAALLRPHALSISSMYHTRLGLLGTLYPIQMNPQYETAFSFSRGGSFEQGINPVDNGIACWRGRYAVRTRISPLRAARKQVGPVRAAHKADPIRAALINVWQVPVQRSSRLAHGWRYGKKH